MPRSSLPWLVLGAIALSAALAWFTLTRGASVGVSSALERHDLPPFHELEIGGAADVTLLQGDAEAVEVEPQARAIVVEAIVSVSGVGNVIVHAERKLRASISGAGNIEYVGDPEVTEDVSGIGQVKRRNSTATPGMRIAADQWRDSTDAAPASLNSSGPPVDGSMSAWTAGRTWTCETRQSRSNPTSIAATSCTVSYG